MYSTLNNDQTKQAIDCEHVFIALQQTELASREYASGMHWKKIANREYLYRTRDGRGNAKCIGLRTPETEHIFDAFHHRKNELSERMAQLRSRMDLMLRLNKALRLGSVPNEVANLCIHLDKAQLLGKGLTIIGTNAMYVYEAMAGVRWTGDITATTDLDLLWHPEKRLSLIAREEVSIHGLIGILKKADKTFEIVKKTPYRAVSANGYMVDLIKQVPKPPWRKEKDQFLPGNQDMQAVEIDHLHRLLDAPQVTQPVFAMDGRIFNMVAPEPRAFAIYKDWLSKEISRNPSKKRRDQAQAEAVRQLIKEHLP